MARFPYTRNAVRRLMSNLYVALIAEYWESENFARNEIATPRQGGVRQQTYDAYEASVDCTAKVHTHRALRVFETLLRRLDRESRKLGANGIDPSELEELREALNRDGYLLDGDLRVRPVPTAATSVPADAQNITQGTRGRLFKYLKNREVQWFGDLDEIAFLSRLYALEELPGSGVRFEDAEGDITQHRYNNYDWEDDWIYIDDRFGLRDGPDAVSLLGAGRHHQGARRRQGDRTAGYDRPYQLSPTDSADASGRRPRRASMSCQGVMTAWSQCAVQPGRSPRNESQSSFVRWRRSVTGCSQAARAERRACSAVLARPTKVCQPWPPAGWSIGTVTSQYHHRPRGATDVSRGRPNHTRSEAVLFIAGPPHFQRRRLAYPSGPVDHSMPPITAGNACTCLSMRAPKPPGPGSLLGQVMTVLPVVPQTGNPPLRGRAARPGSRPGARACLA